MNVDRLLIKQEIDVMLESIDEGLRVDEKWKVRGAIAKLYLQIGENTQANFFAKALDDAPSSAVRRIQELISQTLSTP